MAFIVLSNSGKTSDCINPLLPIMKLSHVILVLIASVLPATAVEIGDTYEAVIAEKGAPATKLEAGGTQVLNYPDQRIKLKSGKVVEVNSKLPDVTTEPSVPAPVIVGGTWTTQYQAALAQAQETNSRVFLFFTGSDWCGWCVRLDREVLSTSEFKTYAKENLILVKLDFPRGVPQTASLKTQNNQLAQKYQVGGFPTVIILDSKGKQIGRTGYQKGGPGAFIDTLKKF
ncbi:MAG: thioredoxin family protein [Opitutaceae bacterium]|nr:thioredoxin family protein [Opitutaceae bacterium]